MKLIINADDLGFSKGINYGIYDAYCNGIVRSTTLMMNMPATAHAVTLFGSTDIGVGVHLNVTAGKPLLGHQHIVDEAGLLRREIPETQEAMAEIRREFIAQIEKAYVMGVDVTHLDSHHHVHLLNEDLFQMTKKIATDYNLKLRCDRQYGYMHDELIKDVQTTDAFSQSFFDKTVYIEQLIQLIAMYQDKDSLEIMVHPGFLDGTLINRDSYREMRMVEHSVLTSQPIKTYIEQHDIQLIHFGEL